MAGVAILSFSCFDRQGNDGDGHFSFVWIICGLWCVYIED